MQDVVTISVLDASGRFDDFEPKYYLAICNDKIRKDVRNSPKWVMDLEDKTYIYM